MIRFLGIKSFRVGSDGIERIERVAIVVFEREGCDSNIIVCVTYATFFYLATAFARYSWMLGFAFLLGLGGGGLIFVIARDDDVFDLVY